MARGLQKAQAQAKGKAKEAAKKGGNSTLKADKGLKVSVAQRLYRITDPDVSTLPLQYKCPKVR